MGQRLSTRKPATGRAALLLRRFGWLAASGFLFNGNWEWLQTPFYRDTTRSTDTIVRYRLHCTLGDVLILLGCALVVSVATRGTAWLEQPRRVHLAGLSGLGAGYTALSEHLNVAMRQAWTYSELMPTVPRAGIGLVPLVQWLVLPALSALLAGRALRGSRRGI